MQALLCWSCASCKKVGKTALLAEPALGTLSLIVGWLLETGRQPLLRGPRELPAAGAEGRDGLASSGLQCSSLLLRKLPGTGHAPLGSWDALNCS